MRIVIFVAIILLSACSQSLDPKIGAILDHNFSNIDKRLKKLEAPLAAPSDKTPTPGKNGK